jgi:hypothetical protein
MPRHSAVMTHLRERAGLQRQIMARKLKAYLSAAVELPRAMDCVALREFLEISHTSFDPRLGARFKEGWLSTTFTTGVHCGDMQCVPTFNSKYWVVLRDSYLAAYDSSMDGNAAQVVQLDAGLEVQSGATVTVATCAPLRCGPGASGDPLTIVVRTNQGELLLRAASKREAEDWVVALRSRIDATPYTQQHALGSFAPPRKHAQTRWFVDGRNAYTVMVEALRSAQYEIFLTGACTVARLQPSRKTRFETQPHALGLLLSPCCPISYSLAGFCIVQAGGWCLVWMWCETRWRTRWCRR